MAIKLRELNAQLIRRDSGNWDVVVYATVYSDELADGVAQRAFSDVEVDDSMTLGQVKNIIVAEVNRRFLS